MTYNYYLGIDVSKGYSDFIFLDSKKRIVLKRFQLYDTFEGHSKLYLIIQQLISRYPNSIIYCGLESTGGYENNWFSKLKEFSINLPLHVARINPFGIHHGSKANMNRVTTDATSAFSIAEYMINHSNKVVYDEENGFVALKQQITHVRLLKLQKVQLLNQLESFIYTAFPELLSFCKSQVPAWMLLLLRKYPTAKKVSRAHIQALCNIPGIKEEKANLIKELARQSTASSTEDTTEILIQSVVLQINTLEKAIKSQIKHIDKKSQNTNYELLKTFPGIAEWSAMVLLIEIGNVERFDNAKKLASYCGLHPKYKQSGDGISKTMMSKQGRKEPRRLLYLAALNGIRNNPILKKTYEKHIAQGKISSVAIGICMHKAIRVIYGMLKSGTAFNPNIDEENQKRSDKKVELADKLEIAEIELEHVQNAPISGRKYREIKTEATHQNE